VTESALADSPDAKAQAEALQELHKHLRVNIQEAQQYQAEYHNKRHIPTAFKPGDYVWLNAKNIRTTRPKKKLDFKRHGPFLIKEPVGKQAYRLDLPVEYGKIHPVFHISLLEKFTESEDREKTLQIPREESPRLGDYRVTRASVPRESAPEGALQSVKRRRPGKKRRMQLARRRSSAAGLGGIGERTKTRARKRKPSWKLRQ
jgi:hypothetical protein